MQITLRNRAAQSDYVTSLIEIRQNELNLQKNINQIQVDVQNAVIGIQQARARYDAAVKARTLQQQTLEADQKKNALGASTIYQVVQDQRDLASAASSVTQAMANYTHARIALDQALGTTLEVNGVSLDEAKAGRVARPSALPAKLPEGQKAMNVSRALRQTRRRRIVLHLLFLGPIPIVSIDPVKPSGPIFWRPYLDAGCSARPQSEIRRASRI